VPRPVAEKGMQLPAPPPQVIHVGGGGRRLPRPPATSRLLLVMPPTMTPKTQKAKREKGRTPSKHLVVLWGQHPPLG
jgi:hypothetical protein